ncbi:unnamed protein product, partial [Timema podura]|nr:unnamed protein product [Timema podura]
MMGSVYEVEYVKQEAKIVYLLECLQKTTPPVLIFAEKKQDVDAIHEYLLLKGVEAVAIHGGKGDMVSIHKHTNGFRKIWQRFRLSFIIILTITLLLLQATSNASQVASFWSTRHIRKKDLAQWMHFVKVRK